MSILTMDEWIELNMEAAFALALFTLGPYPSSSSGDRISCGVCANASCRQIRIRTTSNLARDHVAEKAISSLHMSMEGFSSSPIHQKYIAKWRCCAAEGGCT